MGTRLIKRMTRNFDLNFEQIRHLQIPQQPIRMENSSFMHCKDKLLQLHMNPCIPPYRSTFIFLHTPNN